ncbi:dienelactone hydrolase family protein [Maribacter sp. MMG018]|uniref:dienelactone hydrolase family protein n=1 Tax=Maribacter sp. MMG018 TaxID=2822688 RepID=UPI001B37367C|nr:dienelactone hydrolase family protein [Maribacter sp. MMG018]MBQ4913772.1 dienelactone hydrolase family protein [Maribacter sp. MMG018]
MKSASIILLFLIGVSGIYDAQSQESQNKAAKAFSRIKLKANKVSDVTLMNDYGKRYKARVRFPDDIKNKKPLIVALHYAGNYGTYKEFHDCLVAPGLKELNAYVICPEGEEQLWTTENNIEKIRSLVHMAIKYWNIDKTQIAIMGYSNGGNGSWFFAEHYPELFSAAIPMASSYPVKTKISIPVYAIHGAKDELFLASKTENYINSGIEKGSNITFIKNERLSHFEACAYSEELKKSTKWLQNIWNIK